MYTLLFLKLAYCKSIKIILMQVRTLDDASIFFLAGLSHDLFTLLEKIFKMHSKGELKGQVAKRGTIGKNLDLKGSNFKPLRGLDLVNVRQLSQDLISRKLSLQELSKECSKIKQLHIIQRALVEQTGSESWDEAERRFPAFTSSKALDEFTCNAKLTDSPRLVS